jgi:nucleotide-binding universal stress UspA family protein
MKVLFATDGSLSAEAAGSLLARLPHSDRLELTIMAVTPILEVFGVNEVVEWAKSVSTTEKEFATKVCQHLAKVFDGADAKIEIVVVEGNPGAAIVSQAKARGCELIVLGAIGHSSLERVIQGSVSELVATKAHCSVLIVRPDSIPDGEFNICVAYDDSQPSKVIFEDLAKFKWGKGVQLNIAHAVETPFSYSDVPLAYDMTPILTEMKEIVGKVAASVENQFPNVKPHVFEANHAGAGIVDFAAQHRSNLIMLGDTGKGLIGEFLLGSVSRFVLRHAKGSVWIARKRDQ